MAPRDPIYLDHHATTPLDERVLDAMLPFLREDFGNAASTSHVYGWRAAKAVDDAREEIASLFGAEAREVVFTSGATEANNLALFGALRARAAKKPGRDRLVTLATEHPAVLDPARALEAEGHRVELLPVDADGLVDPGRVREAVDDRTALVSVMAANNEIGVLQPLPEIAAIAREAGAWFHSDAAQAAGKIPLRMDAHDFDLLSLSGHKCYGPKGVGALLVRARRPRVRLEPVQLGGGHEGGLRSGTLPVAAIVGLARALSLCEQERDIETQRVGRLRDRLAQRIGDALTGVHLNGSRERRLAGNLNLSFDDVDIDKLLLALPELAVSTGSACSSAKPEPSHVLLALGHGEDRARRSLRFGLGRATSEADVDRAAEAVIRAVRTQRGSIADAEPAG